MAKIDIDSSFLDDALDFCGQKERYYVADALYCHLHNTGQALEGNTDENDVEWMARNLYEEWASQNYSVCTQWNLASDEAKVKFRDFARVCLKMMPRLQQRIASRLILMSKVLQDIERAERAAYKAKGGE